MLNSGTKTLMVIHAVAVEACLKAVTGLHRRYAACVRDTVRQSIIQKDRVGASHLNQFVDAYLARMSGKEMGIDRLVTEPCGLDAAGMMVALGHPGLGRLGIPFMADVMAPDCLIYFDAIFGAYHGQAVIRAWLLLRRCASRGPRTPASWPRH